MPMRWCMVQLFAYGWTQLGRSQDLYPCRPWTMIWGRGKWVESVPFFTLTPHAFQSNDPNLGSDWSMDVTMSPFRPSGKDCRHTSNANETLWLHYRRCHYNVIFIVARPPFFSALPTARFEKAPRNDTFRQKTTRLFHTAIVSTPRKSVFHGVWRVAIAFLTLELAS